MINRKKIPEPPARPPRGPYPEFRATAQRGLTAQQAHQLLALGWGNEPVESPTKSDQDIIKENVFTYFNLIFVVLALCLLLVGDWKNMTFMIVVVANAGIGIVQQIRAKRVIDQLSLLAETQATAIRDGAATPVPVHELVRGDVIQLTAGAQIPADAVVLTGQIQVNEGLITGEADAIQKKPGDTLLSGSFVISGTCRCRLEQVGADAYAARLTLAAKRDGGAVQKSEMMRSLNRLIQVIGVALVPIGIALFCTQFFRQDVALRQSVASTVAALNGMIPEGLFLLTSVALAVSVVRLAQKKTLVHEMSAIETLARVDVLCVDKTGTITSPEMHVREVVRLSDGPVEDVLAAFFAAMPADNDTAKAIQARFPNAPGWTVDGTVPFSSQTKWSAVNFKEHGTYVLGAPESILADHFSEVESTIQPYAQEGCRVLLLASCDAAKEKTIVGTPAPQALIVLENPIRENAPEVFGYFRDQGVAVKVISGDNPVTVSAVAARAGIPGAEQWVDARTLKTEGDIHQAIGKYNVFGRVAPNQKQQIVHALQAAGHTVAMTGDGVNDVLALKDADCGIAMASGAEAAAHVAQIVLLDSDFSAMPMVVAEGRRVINNIQRASSLYLVKNIFSFFLALISLFAAIPYPFVPIQLTLISSLTIGIPSFFLALEPNHELVKGKFLPNVLRRAWPGALTAIIVILYGELFSFATGLGQGELSTLCVILMTVNGLVVVYHVSQPLTVPRIALIAVMALAAVIAVVTQQALFSLAALSFGGWLVLIALLLLIYPFQTTIDVAISKFGAMRDEMAAKKRT